MIRTLLHVVWFLSIIALLTIQVITARRGSWGADEARDAAVRRAMRPHLWAASAVGLLSLLGLLITSDD